MRTAYLPFYFLIILVNLLPFIPLSIKGIVGLIFIVISCIRQSYKDGLITAGLCMILEFIEFALKINVDYKNGIISMILGSTLYFITAFYLGSFAEALRNKNNELQDEIERRKNIAKELKEKLTLLQSLMNTIPSPIFFKDLDYKYIGCNRSFEESIGITSRELIGKTIYDIVDIDLAKVHHEMNERTLESLNGHSYEEVVKFADGTWKNIFFTNTVFKDENDNPAGIVGVMTDITDKIETVKLKQSLIENKQIMDEIMENDKMKTEFFSNISHELRTPINVILGSAQLMDLYLKNNQYNNSKEKISKNISAMKQNCYRLMRIVNNLIDISKIDAKAFEIHLKNCNIVSVVEEITLSVSDYIENKGINLVFDTDIEEKVMACDDEKIERIMLNLLSNAIKFTPEGGEILVNVYDRDNGVSIKVADNGIGIPEDKQNLIFQRFCQIDGMFTRQHEGSGIGLSLVKSLVDMHGGTITFESKPGKGTSFLIYLPYKKVDEEVINYNTLSKQTNIERINVEFSDIYSI